MRDLSFAPGDSTPIKPHWIVDQEALLRRRSGGDLGNVIDQGAVVRRLFFHIGVRPIGAPDDAIGKMLGQRAAERRHIVIGRPGKAHALRTGRLDPEILVLVYQAMKALVLRMVDALLY